MRITATGPNPDIDLYGQMLSDLMLKDGGLVRHVINDMATSVEQIVNGFGHRWTSPSG